MNQPKLVDHNKPPFYQNPREKPASEIKLLRIEIIPKSNSPFEMVGHDWSPAQPTDSLNPLDAANKLGMKLWDLGSKFHHRYETLQRRFPPQIHSEMHSILRPCAEMLSEVAHRLNWYWSSGLIPPAFTVSGPASVQMYQQAPQESQADHETLDHLLGKCLDP